MDVILSYCHYSLNDTSLLELVSILNKHQVGLVNASPLSMGLLNSRPVADWHPADNEIIHHCKKAAAYCEKYGEDIAKLAVQFSTANEQIPTTLVSTASEQNIIKNIKWLEDPINEELLQEVLSILKPIHNHTRPSGKLEYRQTISQIGGGLT